MSSDEERRVALEAEAALASARVRLKERLWPDDERALDAALSVLRKLAR